MKASEARQIRDEALEFMKTNDYELRTVFKGIKESASWGYDYYVVFNLESNLVKKHKDYLESLGYQVEAKKDAFQSIYYTIRF